MEFCPSCANMLQFELPQMGKPARFSCPTCPYVANIQNYVKIERNLFLAKKAIDPIFSKEDLRSTQETTIDCPNPNCKGKTAGFYELQTRSADEPMTLFYQCRTCQYTWREG